MSDLIFYTNPQSRGRIIHWMMEELAEPYDTVWLEYGPEGTKSEDYLAINPMGKIPTVTHNGAVITETPAICTYLAATFPEKNLIPAVDSPHLAQFYRWLFFAAGPLELAVTVKAMGWEVPEGRQVSAGFGTMDDVLNALETAVAEGPYICGEQFTAADVYVGSHINWGMSFGTLEKRPAFENYAEKINSRPALQRADQINEEKLSQSES